MSVNKDEAIRCLHIAQKHRTNGNHTSALKFARKSVALYSTPEGIAMVSLVEREMVSESTKEQSSSQASTSASASGSATPTTAKATGVEEHVTSAHARPGHRSKAPERADSGGDSSRSYTAKQVEVVKRVISCKHHEYYEILAVDKTCSENDVKRAYKKVCPSRDKIQA